MIFEWKRLKFTFITLPCLLIAFLAICVFCTEANAQGNYDDGLAFILVQAKLPRGAERNTNRPGKDYKNFNLEEPNPKLCMAACEKDAKCRAYTYVKPGVQGKKARCWLKSGVPKPKKNKCCISGVKTIQETVVEKSTEVPDDNIPPGSYQQTCTDISVSGTTLTAYCARISDTDMMYRSDLADINLCRGDISNNDGRLTCKKPTNIPRGSYMQTCENISVSETTLTAYCATKSDSRMTHRTQLSEIDLCLGDISNNDGYLTCEKTYYPPGSYQQTCRVISVSGTTLTAYCAKKSGDWGMIYRTQLSEIDLCRGCRCHVIRGQFFRNSTGGTPPRDW